MSHCGCVSIYIHTCKLSCMTGANLRLNYILCALDYMGILVIWLPFCDAHELKEGK